MNNENSNSKNSPENKKEPWYKRVCDNILVSCFLPCKHEWESLESDTGMKHTVCRCGCMKCGKIMYLRTEEMRKNNISESGNMKKIKRWFEQLFCKHEWEDICCIGKHRYYNHGPGVIYVRQCVCKKCGKPMYDDFEPERK